MVLGQGLALVTVGAATGLTLAVGTGQLPARGLFGLPSPDVLTSAGAALLFAVIGPVACYAPTRRARRIDAMTALRSE